MVKKNKIKTSLLIDMSMPTDNNISVKEYYKISKYKNLKIKIKKMWHFKTTTQPIIVKALCMIKKETETH